jgi:hypothetical protein
VCYPIIKAVINSQKIIDAAAITSAGLLTPPV